MHEQVVVVGAGIAGLTAAFRLQQRGCEVVVLEESAPERVGGRMASVERSGLVVDLGAPLLANRYHRMLRLVADVGLAGRVLAASDQVAVVDGDRVHRGRTGSAPRLLAGGFMRAIPAVDCAKVLRDLHRLRGRIHAADLADLAGRERRSVVEYAARRGLSQRTLDLLLDPLNHTLTLTEPEESADIGALAFLAFLLGSHGFFTFAAGSGALPQAIASHLNIVHRAAVTSVTATSPEEAIVRWNGPDGSEGTRRAQAVVLAIPAHRIREIYDGLPPDDDALFASTKYARVVQVTFHLDRTITETAVLLTLPRTESPVWASAVLQHNLSPARIPAGRGLVTCYLRSAATRECWDLDDTEISDRIIVTARRMNILPELRHATRTDVDRIDPCVVTRAPGDFERIARARATVCREGPVVLAGGDLYGYSTTIGSLHSGERAATQVLGKLRPTSDGETPWNTRSA